jgi:Family of unknown function (DUF5677)
MPSDPFLNVLDRDRAKVEAREVIDIACPLLREMVNYATNAYVRCLRAADKDRQGDENEDVAAMILYAHLIEQIDAVEVLMSNSCVNGAVPVLRTAFEASLSLEYILISDADYVQRSLAWLCGYLHRRIQKHEGLDRTTEHGAGRVKAMDDHFGSTTPTYDSGPPVTGLRSVLARPQFAALEADYVARVKRSKTRVPEWFSLLNGPKNRHELSRLLKHEPDYLILYGEWSDIAHATDAALYLGHGKQPKQGAAFTALRDARAMPERAFMGVSFLLRSTRLMSEHFRPNDPGLRRWYLRDVQASYQRLNRLHVNVVDVE